MLESVSPLCVSLWLSSSIYALFVFSSTLGETDLYSRLLPIEIKNVKLKLSKRKEAGRQKDHRLECPELTSIRAAANDYFSNDLFAEIIN